MILSKFQHHKAYCLALSLVMISLFSCREIYDPETDSMDNVLIVEGIVSDQPGKSRIKLMKNHDESDESDEFPGAWTHFPHEYVRPVKDATVFVTNDLDSIIAFHPDNNGVYSPDISFTGEPGRTYILSIETDNGQVYKSDPQLMVAAARIDSVYPEHQVKEYLFLNHGNYVRKRAAGVDVRSDLSNEDGNVLRFRMEPTLLLLYNYVEVLAMGAVDVHYYWKKVRLSDAPDISKSYPDGGNHQIKNHLISFMPSDRSSYQIDLRHNIHRFIVIIRYFTLNEPSYRFHQEVYKQVNSENKIFDPIASQLPSNIKCVSDEKIPVAGFFEASSLRSETYMLDMKPYDNIFRFVRIGNLENVSDEGETINNPPYFWQD